PTPPFFSGPTRSIPKTPPGTTPGAKKIPKSGFRAGRAVGPPVPTAHCFAPGGFPPRPGAPEFRLRPRFPGRTISLAHPWHPARQEERPMSSTGSAPHWIRQLKQGAPTAADRLWKSYVGKLIGLARQRLAGGPRRGADEEDVALSAFDNFFR